MRRHQVNNWYGIIMVSAFSLLIVTAAFARDDAFQHREWNSEQWDQAREQMYSQLKLTPQQQEALNNNREENREVMKALSEKMKEKRSFIDVELKKQDYDEGKIRQWHQEIRELKNQAADARLDKILKARKILTPEQYAEFDQLKKTRREKFRKSLANQN